jgi:hypothetical protein
VGGSAAHWHDPLWKLDAFRHPSSNARRQAIVKRLIPLLERLEQATERVSGALLRGSAAVLSRALRRGPHRPWRRS